MGSRLRRCNVQANSFFPWTYPLTTFPHLLRSADSEINEIKNWRQRSGIKSGINGCEMNNVLLPFRSSLWRRISARKGDESIILKDTATLSDSDASMCIHRIANVEHLSVHRSQTRAREFAIRRWERAEPIVGTERQRVCNDNGRCPGSVKRSFRRRRRDSKREQVATGFPDIFLYKW